MRMTENTLIPMSLLARLEDAPYGAYAIDLDQSIVFWNAQAEHILGYDARYALGRKCYEVVPGLALDSLTPFCSRNCPAIVAANRGQIPPVSYVRMQCASGQMKRITVIPLIATGEDDRVLLIHMFHETPADEPTGDKPMEMPLTPLELEVLSLLSLGLRPTDIAGQLFISVYTVRKHISNACEKLHSHGMMSAVLAAQRNHLI